MQEIVRFPINIRPLFFTEKSRNPKGLAFFYKSYLIIYKLTKDNKYREIAEDLLNRLLENNSNKNGKYHGN